MIEPLIPSTEPERLQELRSYGILDSPPEPVFDDLSALARELAGVPIGIISLVDENRQWFKSCLGLDVKETPRNVSFCGHTILQRQPLIIGNALADPRFADNPLVTGSPDIRFYAGFPLVAANGQVLGSLCVIDTIPRQLNEQKVSNLKRLARVVVQLMEKRRDQARLAEFQRHALSQPEPAAGSESMFIPADQLRSVLTLMIDLQERPCFALMQLELKDLRRITMALGERMAEPLRRTLQSRLIKLLPPDASCCELNDHEWLILLPFANQDERVKALAETITASLERPVKLNDHPFRSSVAIGIALFRDNYSDLATLMADTALALRHAENQLTSAVNIIDLATRLQAQDELRLEVELRHGLHGASSDSERGTLELHLQPLVRLNDGSIHGFEALARWRQCDGRLLSPTQFLPAAARADLLVELDLQILDLAIEACSSLATDGSNGRLLMSINLSDAVLSQPEALGRLLSLLDQQTLPPGWCLQFELVEASLQLNPEDLADKLLKLKERNLKLAIDDFGSGYSSLARLNRYPFDTLKVDQMFVQQINRPERPSNRILEVIQAMATSLDLSAVAEGVETEEQRQWLQQRGFLWGQGYLFGRPEPLAQAQRRLADQQGQSQHSCSI